MSLRKKVKVLKRWERYMARCEKLRGVCGSRAWGRRYNSYAYEFNRRYM